MNTEKLDSIWTNLQKSDTLESLGEMIAALQEMMDKKKKESIVKEKFGEFQTVKKKKQNKEVTYFRAYYYEDGKRKDKTASTVEGLVESGLCWRRTTSTQMQPLRKFLSNTKYREELQQIISLLEMIANNQIPAQKGLLVRFPRFC